MHAFSDCQRALNSWLELNLHEINLRLRHFDLEFIDIYFR